MDLIVLCERVCWPRSLGAVAIARHLLNVPVCSKAVARIHRMVFVASICPASNLLLLALEEPLLATKLRLLKSIGKVALFILASSGCLCLGLAHNIVLVF